MSERAHETDPGRPLDTDALYVRVRVVDLAPGETRAFAYCAPGPPGADGEPNEFVEAGFVVNHGGELHVWINRCPHVPYSLDFGDGRFMSRDRLSVVCSNHGARFDPGTGRCYEGPPRGRSLLPLPFVRDADDVIVTVRPARQRR